MRSRNHVNAIPAGGRDLRKRCWHVSDRIALALDWQYRKLRKERHKYR